MKKVFLLSSSASLSLAIEGLLCDCHSTCKGPELVYYCGTDEEDVWVNPCFSDAYSSLSFCDESLDIKSRVADLILRIPDDEKLGSAGTSTPLSNYATELPSVGIPYSQWWSEALHGVAVSPGVLFDKTTPYATSFPQIISTSHSFNRTLFAAIGRAISTEVRAFSNLGNAGLTYWTPNLNIFRDPRWGRGQETPGEDPYLTSEYVAAYVPALQYDNDADGGKHLKVSACCKHYVAYSLENYEGVDRHHFDANVTAQDMADTYLPAFEACASPAQGGGSCVMCSYNNVNGVPTCANPKLLKDLMRDTWQFDGYITSDCGAVEDVYNTHYYASTPREAVADVLSAGMDMECGKWFDSHLKAAVSAGLVTMDQVDAALSNLLAIHMRMGRFDKSGTAYDTIGWSAVNSDLHQQIAREAAQQAVVMLKNDDSALPLSAKDVRSLAVIGPNANATKTMKGNYAGHPPFIISPLEALSTEVDQINYALGCDIESNSTDDFGNAVAAAKASDAVVLVMGIDQSQEREGHDRTEIKLSGVQYDLIEEVLVASSGKKVILVIMSGGAVCLGRYRDDSRVSSILYVGYPGQAGGGGIADVVFGHYSPSGRLTQTFYKQSFMDEVSFYDMNMRPTSGVNPGRGYRFYQGDSVVYPFGAGLSFTSFEYSWASDYHLVKSDKADSSGFSVDVTVVIANTGQVYTAAETVLLYMQPPQSAPQGSPLKVMRAFDKIQIDPGMTSTVSFQLDEEDFSLADSSGNFTVVPGEWIVHVGVLQRSISI